VTGQGGQKRTRVMPNHGEDGIGTYDDYYDDGNDNHDTALLLCFSLETCEDNWSYTYVRLDGAIALHARQTGSRLTTRLSESSSTPEPSQSHLIILDS